MDELQQIFDCCFDILKQYSLADVPFSVEVKIDRSGHGHATANYVLFLGRYSPHRGDVLPQSLTHASETADDLIAWLDGKLAGLMRKPKETFA